MRPDLLEVRRRAWAIFRETYRYPSIPYHRIGRACLRWSVREAARQLVHGTQAEQLEREAQETARRFGFNNSSLMYQRDRWSFGSLSTTWRAAHMRRVYCRALEIARAGKALPELQAAE